MPLFFIGCDSTSAFQGKGKVKPWKVLQMYPKFVESFYQLGRSAEVSEELLMSSGRFVCLLYGDQTSTSVNNCRYQLFKSGKYSDDALPPNGDSLQQHIKRANLQALAWNRCLSAQLQLPPAAGNGWKLTDGQLEIVWMTRPPAPESLLEYVSCKCQSGCKTKRCTCLKSGLQCTDLCGCKDCQNSQEEEQNLAEMDERLSYFVSSECDSETDDDFVDSEC